MEINRVCQGSTLVVRNSQGVDLVGDWGAGPQICCPPSWIWTLPWVGPFPTPKLDFRLWRNGQGVELVGDCAGEGAGP